MKAVISIDYTNDFVATNGKLTVGEPAQLIENQITKIAEEALENGDFVIFAIDCHEVKDKYHPESQLFPPHNLKYSDGRNLYGKLGEFYQEHKNKEQIYWMDKRHYSAFSGTDLDIRLRERRIETVLITGVMTNICVLHTAIDAYQLGYKIELAQSAVASIDEKDHKWAINHIKNVLGANLID